MVNLTDSERSGIRLTETELVSTAEMPSRRRRWLGPLLAVAVWFVFWAILEKPFDQWLLIATALTLVAWLYNRVCGRVGLPRVNLKFERVDRITLTHLLLAMLLLVMVATYSELVKLNEGTEDVRNAVIEAHDGTSSDADEIRSSLDDVKVAIELQ